MTPSRNGAGKPERTPLAVMLFPALIGVVVTLLSIGVTVILRMNDLASKDEVTELQQEVAMLTAQNAAIVAGLEATTADLVDRVEQARRQIEALIQLAQQNP